METLFELKKWRLINACETVEELQQAILDIADPTTKEIQGRSRPWKAEKLASYVPMVVERGSSANLLTREYGIRQQALYIRSSELNESSEV